MDVHIKVKNFGPIQKAEIDLRPLTVFVGESNTGKTYLAALITLPAQPPCFSLWDVGGY